MTRFHLLATMMDFNMMLAHSRHVLLLQVPMVKLQMLARNQAE